MLTSHWCSVDLAADGAMVVAAAINGIVDIDIKRLSPFFFLLLHFDYLAYYLLSVVKSDQQYKEPSIPLCNF